MSAIAVPTDPGLDWDGTPVVPVEAVISRTRMKPSKINRLCIDFDGTLFEYGELDGPFRLNWGSKWAVTKFEMMGYEIVVYTSRLSKRWLRETGRTYEQEYSLVENALWANEIFPHDITGEKVNADAYIDDRAIRFTGDWEAVLRQVRHG